MPPTLKMEMFQSGYLINSRTSLLGSHCVCSGLLCQLGLLVQQEGCLALQRLHLLTYPIVLPLVLVSTLHLFWVSYSTFPFCLCCRVVLGSCLMCGLFPLRCALLTRPYPRASWPLFWLCLISWGLSSFCVGGSPASCFRTSLGPVVSYPKTLDEAVTQGPNGSF